MSKKEVLSSCRSLPSGPTPTSSPKIEGDDTAASAPVFDRTTQLALAFLEAKDEASIKATYNCLLEFVFRARGSLYLTEPGLTSFEATHEFLEGWLVDQLLPYCNSGKGREAAKNGEFRYLAKRSRNALIDELRRRERSKDLLDRPLIRMDSAIGNDHSWHDLVGVDCQQKAACPIGTKPSLEPSALQQKLRQSRPEIAKTLGEQLFEVLSIVCDLFPDRLSLGEVTRGIAKARAVSEQTARKLHHALARKLGSLRGDPIVQEFVEVIRSAGDPVRLSTVKWDAESQGFTPN